MPMSSTDVSQLIQNQQAMFGNSAALAQQLGIQHGTAPPGTQMPSTYSPSAMADPRSALPFMGPQDPGASIGHGGIAAAGAGIGIAGFAAQMYGGAGGYNFGGAMAGRGMMDPFLTTGRAMTQGFWGGAGITKGALGGSQGLGATLAHIPGMLKGPGGVGRLMAGIGGAAGAGMIAAAPYAALGLAADFTAGNMLQGSQEFMGTRQMLQGAQRSMMPQMATGFSTEDSGDVTSMMRNMAGKDINADFGQLQNIMGAGMQSGQFKNVGNVQQFKQRFKEMVTTLKEVSSVFNTSMQEALPLLQEQQRMGMFTPGAITTNVLQQRTMATAAGVSSGAMRAVEQAGASISRAYGGMGASGVRAIRGATGAVGGALGAGIFSEAQLSEATGGLMGDEAVTAFAQRMTGRAFQMTRSRMGRMTVGALMNEEGTGLDQEAVESYQAGDMSRRQMMKRFRANTKSRSGKAALRENYDDLSSQFVDEVGPMGVIAGQVRNQLGGRLDSESDDNVIAMIQKKFAGMGRRQSKMVMQMARKGGELNAIISRGMSESRNAMEQEANMRDTASWDAVMKKVAQDYLEPVQRAVRSAGQEFTEWTSKEIEGVLSSVTGTRKTRVGASAAKLDQTLRAQGSMGGFGAASKTEFETVKPMGITGLVGGAIGGVVGLVTGRGAARGAAIGYGAGLSGQAFLSGKAEQGLEREMNSMGMSGGAGRMRSLVTGDMSMSDAGLDSFSPAERLAMSKELNTLGRGVGSSAMGVDEDATWLQKEKAYRGVVSGRGSSNLQRALSGPKGMEAVRKLGGGGGIHAPDYDELAGDVGYKRKKMGDIDDTMKAMGVNIARAMEKRGMGRSWKKAKSWVGDVRGRGASHTAAEGIFSSGFGNIMEDKEVRQRFLSVLAMGNTSELVNKVGATDEELSTWLGREIDSEEADMMRDTFETILKDPDAKKEMIGKLSGELSEEMDSANYIDNKARSEKARGRGIGQLAGKRLNDMAMAAEAGVPGYQTARAGLMGEVEKMMDEGTSASTFRKLSSKGAGSIYGDAGAMGEAAMGIQTMLKGAGGRGKEGKFKTQMGMLLRGKDDNWLKTHKADLEAAWEGNVSTALRDRLKEKYGDSAVGSRIETAITQGTGLQDDEVRGISATAAAAGMKTPESDTVEKGGVLGQAGIKWTEALEESTLRVQEGLAKLDAKIPW